MESSWCQLSGMTALSMGKELGGRVKGRGRVGGPREVGKVGGVKEWK